MECYKYQVTKNSAQRKQTRNSSIKKCKSHVLIINNKRALQEVDNEIIEKTLPVKLPIHYIQNDGLSPKIVFEIEFYRHFRHLFSSLYYPFNQQIQKILMYQIRLLNIYHDCKNIDDLFKNILKPIVNLLWIVKNEILVSVFS
jgi:hypothetical protein